MNDRLMIAAMAMQGMLASPDCIGDAQAVSGDAIECADALLASFKPIADEDEDTLTGEEDTAPDYTMTTTTPDKRAEEHRR